MNQWAARHIANNSYQGWESFLKYLLWIKKQLAEWYFNKTKNFDVSQSKHLIWSSTS